MHNITLLHVMKNVGWIRCVFCIVIHQNQMYFYILVDYDAKNTSNPPYHFLRHDFLND